MARENPKRFKGKEGVVVPLRDGIELALSSIMRPGPRHFTDRPHRGTSERMEAHRKNEQAARKANAGGFNEELTA